MTKVKRFNSTQPLANVKGGHWVKASDYDTLAAKLADAERVARYETDVAQQAIDEIKALKSRADLAAPLDDPRVKALVEAAKELHDKAVEKHQRGRSDIWPVIRKTRAAIAAIEGGGE